MRLGGEGDGQRGEQTRAADAGAIAGAMAAATECNRSSGTKKKHHTLSRTTEYSTQWECECERGVIGDGELNRTQKAHQSEGAGVLATTPLHRRTVFGIAFGSLSCLS